MQVSPEESRTEWLSLKAAIKKVSNSNLLTSNSSERLVRLLVSDYAGDYPNMVSILEWGLAICQATAEGELDFSLFKLMKSTHRNHLLTEALERQMAIKCDAPRLHMYPLRRAWKCGMARLATPPLPHPHVQKSVSLLVRHRQQQQQQVVIMQCRASWISGNLCCSRCLWVRQCS